VTQTDNSAPDSHSASLAARLAGIALILATLYLCYFHNLGAIGFVGPDEPRYAWIARDMMETGDWVTPRLYGQPWFEKPPLYYWAAALSFKLIGVSEASARFPSALAALFATLAMAWLAWRIYGPETARWLLLLLPTTVGMIGFSHAAATDMPFAAMLTMAMVCAARLLNLFPARTPLSSASFTSSTSFASFFFGFFLGLAVLAKGPAAIVLSGGAVLLWAISTKRWRDAFRCLHPVAIVSFCLTALPWYILCARRNPEFFRIFIIEHNFKRYLTPEFQHVQPFWFYIPVLLVAFVPWSLTLLWSVLRGAHCVTRPQRSNPITILWLCWSIFCLMFFSVSKSKLPGYILPTVPAISLLLAHSLVRLVPYEEKIFRWLHVGFSSLGVPVGLLLLLQMGPHFHTPRLTGQAMKSIGWALLLFALANLLLAMRHRVRSHAVSINIFCVAPILVLLLVFPQVSAPWLHYDPSGRTLALELKEMQVPLDHLYIAKMRRGQELSLDFYLHRQLQIWDVAQPKAGLLLLSSRACSLYVKSPWECTHDPLELTDSGCFVFNVVREDSAGELGALGGSGSENGTNRQPR
jgi:4-amino-4-deoxy-L-arabinose transferase-like glycosyltransferase